MECSDRGAINSENVDLNPPAPVEDTIPPAHGKRARQDEAGVDTFERGNVPADEVGAVDAGVGDAAAAAPEELLTPSELQERLELLCLGGEGPPTTSGRPRLARDATNALLKACCEAVHAFFEQSGIKATLRQVTPTAQIDREEAKAFLAGCRGRARPRALARGGARHRYI